LALSRHERHGRRDGVWWAGLVVAAAAAAATAHGLYAVAEASGVPWPMAALYPVMTDGLALVAYSATNRLTGGPRRYAWAVVVLAAGLSGTAQAVYLAGGGLDDAPAEVRFGIGAAPALAAAAVAHLLHLIRTAAPTVQEAGAVQPVAEVSSVQPPVVQPAEPAAGEYDTVEHAPVQRSAPLVRATPIRSTTAAATGAAERARRAAQQYCEQHGTLPTASTLVRLSDVSRGTAGTVLKGLRTESASSPTTTGTASTAANDESPAPGPDESRAAPDDHPTHSPSKIQSHHTPMHHDPQEDQLQRSPTAGETLAGAGR
jgi:hypothetical protein